MTIYEREIKRIAEGDLPWEKLAEALMSHVFFFFFFFCSLGLPGCSVVPGGCADGEKCEMPRVRRKNPGRKFAALRTEMRKRAKERFASYMGTEDLCSQAHADVNREVPECGQVDYVIHAGEQHASGAVCGPDLDRGRPRRM